LPVLPGPRIHKIAELEYAIDPSTRVDGKIKEDRSAIPLFTVIFIRKNQNNGSLFRKILECNGIRDNNGIQFLYLRKYIATTSSRELQVV
jgi:hypothetical protein